MKYNQPFDATDPTGQAPYINGNPAASIQGSIPPAAAFEAPQREIVAVIAEPDDGVPTNDDLKQLLKTIRSGKLTTFVGAGSANSITIAAKTPHATLFKGLPFRVFPSETNTQAAVDLVVNGTLAGRITRTNGSPLQSGDIEGGCPFDVVHDGQRFRLMGPGRAEIPRIVRDEIIWVSTDGDDSNDGRSQATALKTLAAALNKATLFYTFGAALPIYLAKAGEYPWPASPPQLRGAILIRGNPASQNSYIIGGAGPASGGRGVIEADGYAIALQGVKVLNTGTTNHTVAASGGGQLSISNVTLESTQPINASHVFVAGSASGCAINNGCVWASSAQAMISVVSGGVSITSNAALAVTNTPNWAVAAAAASDGGTIGVRGGVSIGGSATGPRYTVTSNAIIRTNGLGQNFFPGSSPGTPDTGGQYFP